MEKVLNHVLLTRFSVRMKPGVVIRARGKEWLFNVSRLQAKLALFKNITLPSVTGNSTLPDKYLILIDPELPVGIREELENLIRPYPFIELFSCPQDQLIKYSEIGWIREVYKSDAPYLLTTNLDDDDALTLDYFQNAREESILLCKAGVKFQWLGTKQVLDWDVPLQTNSSEFGFMKPCDDGVNFFYSPGLSLISPNNDKALSVFCVGHDVVNEVFERNPKGYRHLSSSKVLRARFSILKRIILAKYPLKTALRILINHNLTHDFSSQGKSKALMTNHGDNLVKNRIDARIQSRIKINFNDEQSLREKFGVLLGPAASEFAIANQQSNIKKESKSNKSNTDE